MDENNDLNPIQLSVVHAGTPGGPDRKIRPNQPCRMCPDPILPTDVVVRFLDFDAGPGTREHVMHKRCVQLLLDVTIDDDDETRFEQYQAGLERYSAN